MVVDGDDGGSWCRHALSNHALVADVLLSFRDPRILLIPWQHRLDPDWTTAAAGSLPSFEPSDTKTADSEKDDERPSSSLPPPLPAVEFPDWGRRIRRSWTVKASRIREATAGKSRRRRRPSPLSALDGCSSASTSWTSRDGEEGSSSPENAAKMPRSFDDAAPGGGLPSKVSSAPHLSVSFSPVSRSRMVVDGDDGGSWCRHALSNHALVADVLLSFRDPRILLIPWQHRLDPDWTTAAAGSLPSFEPSDTKTADSEKDDERPSSSLPPPLPAVEFPDWGRRIRRSWTVKASRIREATAGKSRRRRRPSPLSALDGCSSASTSWTSRDGEEGSSSPENAAKMPRSFDDAAPGGGLPSKSSLDQPQGSSSRCKCCNGTRATLPVSRQSVSKKFLLPDLNELPDR
ncbi:hypothetical protein C4D60_Mb07t23400 [Musa balbisiana]|uniref:Uncharacterized protein n=1 Tax=Musa balbisiana TaxID=52838 RepID=A0A4S8JIQ1_MUSBA|nr:hypothetical protein C4D60_Mb07t23400 [Musa balbisiana]